MSRVGARAGAWWMVAGWLVGCSGGAEEGTTTPEATPTPGTGVEGETFSNPPELSPNDAGVYELHFQPGEVTIAGQRYCLRTYNGAIPGPTLRVAPGEDRRIRVNLYNQFREQDWREISGEEGYAAPSCHDFNLTNLHFHGGHVQPNFATDDPADPCEGDGCGEGGRYHGDHVLITVAQEGVAQYRWDIDEDGIHHEGTNWYHPHIHGATAIQVVNGAAGALIVEGPLDQEPAVAATRERVMVIAEIPYNHETTVPLDAGESCTEYNLSIDNFLSVTEGMPLLINGRVNPRMVTAPGQVERWRMVYSGTPDEMAMKLHPSLDEDCGDFDETELIDFVQYGRDGITLPQYYVSDTTWVSPGYRVDAFMKMPDTPGLLCLVGRRTHDLKGTVIATVEVREGMTPTTTEIPGEDVVSAHGPAVSWTGKVDGQTTTVSCESVETIHQRVGLLMPPLPAPETQQLSYGEACEPEDHGHGRAAAEDEEICICPEPNINCRKFEQRRERGYRSDRVAVVGSTEKWEIVALDGHPYHIHINPFLVCENNSNKEPNFPHWRDTFWVQAEDGPREVLMHFRGFTGTFVEHCHKLNHEDEGMMELTEICAADDLECQCQRFDEDGACVSQAGCQEDDLHCLFAEEVTRSYPLPPAPMPEICGP